MTTNEVTYNLAGQVRHQGLPVIGVTIAVVDLDDYSSVFAKRQSEKIVAWQKTGGRGEFNFAVLPGYYGLKVLPENGTRFLSHHSGAMSVRSNTSCNIILSTGCVISGDVVAPSGEKILAGSVVALADEPSPYKVTAPIVNGKYNLVVPRGNYHVAYTGYVEPEGNGGEEGDNGTAPLAEPQSASEIMATAPLQVAVHSDVDLTVPLPALHEFTGQVFDQTGQTVNAARIVLAPAESNDKPLFDQLGLMSLVTTDDSGRFRFLVQPGEYKVHIQPDGASSLLAGKEDRVSIYENLERSFNLSSGFRLRGQVNYRDSPVKSCLLRIINGESGQEFQTRSDGQGQFSLTLAAGTYKILAKTERRASSKYGSASAEPADVVSPWTRTVIVGGDTHVAIKLQDGAMLSGKVLDEFGQPRLGVRVSAFEDAEDTMSHQDIRRAMTSAISDDSGNYILFLAAGSYKLVAHRDFARAVSVKMGKEPSKVDLAWTGWNHLHFEVCGEDGKEVARCRLRCCPFTNDPAKSSEFSVDREVFPHDSLITDDTGFCQVTLPVGIYMLEFLPPSTSPYGKRLIRQLSVNTDFTRRVALPFADEKADQDD